MRILIAGATGAIGRPLVRCLKEERHTVFALARSPQSSRVVAESGAEPVTTDALDAASVKAAMVRVRPDVVINELTALPRHYTAVEMKAAAERDRKVRIEGNANLLAALGEARVRRYILQSSGFWYAPGTGLADEWTHFAFDASPGVAAGARTYAELEAAALGTPGVELVSLRYGFFYGPGTWYISEGDMGEQVRQQQVPVIGSGQGVWSFVHIDDAAAATAAALECVPGAYNVVDGTPTPQRLWLPAFALAAGAPVPPEITEQEALEAFGPDIVYYATRLRGASNEKAKRDEFSAAPAGVAISDSTWPLTSSGALHRIYAKCQVRCGDKGDQGVVSARCRCRSAGVARLAQVSRKGGKEFDQRYDAGNRKWTVRSCCSMPFSPVEHPHCFQT